ncbi:hypothetical protein [Aeromicrobium wangtongii]|uniref:Uncharacterized protein n=1 Tax=Aeromicrobium wangtongii TaxID=2969247 RepID=A0ABY5MEX0_9ACTN|nr:hypothetical protein [Aeromicrobium wangtongii]MCD9197986.1 hypothetical protein [Aeromicrobium wangtongii]MCL3819293.1 hypothetical protein [Aeromicrobium wangtongii]UUP15464.1 hypothetical protein NQV15_09155 [Aeromicrobium wangtongii]
MDDLLDRAPRQRRSWRPRAALVVLAGAVVLVPDHASRDQPVAGSAICPSSTVQVGALQGTPGIAGPRTNLSPVPDKGTGPADLTAWRQLAKFLWGGPVTWSPAAASHVSAPSPPSTR